MLLLFWDHFLWDRIWNEDNSTTIVELMWNQNGENKTRSLSYVYISVIFLNLKQNKFEVTEAGDRTEFCKLYIEPSMPPSYHTQYINIWKIKVKYFGPMYNSKGKQIWRTLRYQIACTALFILLISKIVWLGLGRRSQNQPIEGINVRQNKNK